MLSPEYLNLIEFNDVVELYNRLNIEITADIINRVSQMQDITETTKKQLEIIKQTNGTEIFNKALEETSMLTADTKKYLKALFEDMAKEDIEGYKELYEYRDKPFKLSEQQYKLLNQGLKDTNKALKNFTNTIAFQSKQTYVEAVDNAYFKVASGAFDYATAIHTACQELANKGITLKDKLGRNVQLEVAVRRNVMTGIQQTANRINRDIEEYLGCDGYEVTAHLGARPTHAEEQGKQFAISHNTKISRQYPLWSDVEYLWNEYNCRHTYFGIILGVSEPKYTDKELKEFREATVTWNGKKIPYYEATQKQRQLENAIRKQKRTVQILEKANFDNKLEKGQLALLQKKYKDFCKETGLEKDYQRLQVTKNVVTKRDSRDIIRKQSQIKSKNNIVTANNLLDKLNIDIKQYKPFEKYDPYDNDIQEQTAKLIGMDKLPELVSKQEYLQNKGTEITRVLHDYHGKTAEQAYDNTIRGKIQYSENLNSSYGRAIYFGEKDISDSLLSNYGKKDNKIINAKISNKARIIEFENQLEYSKDRDSRLEKVPQNLKEFYKQESSLLYMLDGIDGIRLKWNKYYCIYNRKVLIINGK